MKDLIADIARGLVDNPGAVDVVERSDAEATLIELSVAEDDLGKVIGRNGRTARAMRALLAGISQRDRRRYELEIVD